MATGDGVRLIEYNCRFGDPEAMNVIPLMQADFVEVVRVFWAATNLVGTQVHLTGSRAVAIVGIAASLAEAEQVAERAAPRVEGPVRRRTDITTPALVEARVAHVDQLRG